jgi:hypothetical protein
MKNLQHKDNILDVMKNPNKLGSQMVWELVKCQKFTKFPKTHRNQRKARRSHSYIKRQNLSRNSVVGKQTDLGHLDVSGISSNFFSIQRMKIYNSSRNFTPNGVTKQNKKNLHEPKRARIHSSHICGQPCHPSEKWCSKCVFPIRVTREFISNSRAKT